MAAIMKKTTLDKIASIQMGYSFRTKIEPAASGNVSVIQMKDLTENDEINLSSVDRIDLADFKESHLVQSGDLVFRSRGLKVKSLIVSEQKDLLIISAPLFRVRVIDSKVLPAYLNWYINQPVAQTYLESVSEGTIQKMIGKQSLQNLPIDFPSLEIQTAIVEISGLVIQESQLYRAIADKRSKLITAHLLHLVKEV
jgi:restriction endonuclease S subunit